MARKSLIPVSESVSQFGGTAVRQMLLSGNMMPVKEKVLSLFLQKRNMPVVAVNLDNTSPYMNLMGEYYKFSIHDGGGYDIFSSMSVREACIYCQNVAYDKNYPEEQIVQIIRYLTLIDKLNQYLGLYLPTIRDINAYYYSPEVINNGLNSMFRSGRISMSEYKSLTALFIRGIKGQLIIDNILASADFNLNFNENTSFSVNNLLCGQTALIDCSARHHSYTENRNRNDIFYSIESCQKQIAVAVNVGRTDYSIAENFIRNMTAKPDCPLIVIIDDVFAQVPDYDTFRRMFPVNLLGQHTGESCRKMSECFHEIYRQEVHYARAVDSRLLADRFIDVIFHTNHTDTTTIMPVRRSVIEQQDIANLSERAFIMMNHTGTANYFSIYSI